MGTTDNHDLAAAVTLGDTVVIEDVAANVFAVRIFGKATGTEATPFSATVS